MKTAWRRRGSSSAVRLARPKVEAYRNRNITFFSLKNQPRHPIVDGTGFNDLDVACQRVTEHTVVRPRSRPGPSLVYGAELSRKQEAIANHARDLLRWLDDGRAL